MMSGQGMTADSRRVFIRSFGCQMNVYDAERMADALRPRGFVTTETPEEADLIILNTCHIREKAAEKVYSELGRLRRIREERARAGLNTAIAVAGCVAQAEGEAMLARAPVIDFIFGPQSIHRLPELVDRLEAGERGMVETDFPAEDKFAALEARAKAPPRVPPSVFLSVQEGCDRFCTFCVVPYTRGAEYSRPAAQVLAEARRLIEKGAREITLIGQNVNAWRGEGPDGGEWDLARLLEAVAALEGLERLRFTTSHPVDMTERLIEAFARIDRLMPYLHLPVQAGSDRILRAMNRRHTAAQYLEIIEKVRAVRPDIAISGDFIVGFPGETEEDFQATLDLVKKVEYAQAFSFRYSPRPGTPAAERPDQVPEEVKAERLSRLQALLGEQQEAFNRRFIGQEMDILLEKPGRHPGQLVGRSPWLQAVHVAAEGHRIGDMVRVHITGATRNSLAARLCARETAGAA
jgi:tRNA-2-methylthio-N6-dimethylallyladenosine synthase